MNRSVQEDKVRAGLEDMSDGGLGDTLRLWNEEYFSKQGLFVHMELSESAMKNPGSRSKKFRKPVSFYSSKDDRARKEDERKMMIVVTRLDEDGQPTEAMHELAAADTGPVELGSGDVSSTIPELPGDEGMVPVELPGDEGAVPVELPAESSYSAEKKVDPPSGYVEMSSDNTLLMEKMHIEDVHGSSPTDSEKGLVPRPLAVTPSSQTSFNREMT